MLIKNGVIYTPDYIGKQDILLGFGKIISIQQNIYVQDHNFEVTILDASGKIVVPGFIDQHVHITGGGGEGGPITRTPAITITALALAGITTVVGLLGMDDISRSLFDLLAKAKALEEEGVTTYILTGSYSVPPKTLTGSIEKDLFLVDKVIGVGEVAISDLRSSQPNAESIVKLASEAVKGGLLSQKAGIIHVHLGEGRQGMSPLFDAVTHSDIPADKIIPTHVNRLERLLYEGIKYIKLGGNIDLSAGINPKDDSPDALDIAHSIKMLIRHDINLDNVTVSSDGNGSLPRFDSAGRLKDINIGSTKVLWDDIKNSVRMGIIPLTDALELVTRNVARVLNLLPNKGILAPGSDGDIIILDDELNIETVVALGKILVREGQPQVKGVLDNI